MMGLVKKNILLLLVLLKFFLCSYMYSRTHLVQEDYIEILDIHVVLGSSATFLTIPCQIFQF